MTGRLEWHEKMAIGLKVWLSLLVVGIALRRHSLPEVIDRMPVPRFASRCSLAPDRLGRIVATSLRIGVYRPRCLVSSLVLYRLLHQQGTPAKLIIGLPSDALGKEAHAWVEVDGMDVGPPPGRGAHVELARYG